MFIDISPKLIKSSTTFSFFIFHSFNSISFLIPKSYNHILFIYGMSKNSRYVCNYMACNKFRNLVNAFNQFKIINLIKKASAVLFQNQAIVDNFKHNFTCFPSPWFWGDGYFSSEKDREVMKTPEAKESLSLMRAACLVCLMRGVILSSSSY